MTKNVEVLKAVKYELDKAVYKYQVKCKKEHEKTKNAYVTFQGQQYYTENEIMEAYGCDVMTSAKCDSLIEKLNKKKGIEESGGKTQNQEIYDELVAIRNGVEMDINQIIHLEKEQTERDARIKADMEKGCSYQQALDNEEFLQNCIQMENAGLI